MYMRVVCKARRRRVSARVLNTPPPRIFQLVFCIPNCFPVLMHNRAQHQCYKHTHTHTIQQSGAMDLYKIFFNFSSRYKCFDLCVRACECECRVDIINELPSPIIYTTHIQNKYKHSHFNKICGGHIRMCIYLCMATYV